MSSSNNWSRMIRAELSITSDMIRGVRDVFPITEEGEIVTPNQRRAIRKSVQKLLAIWRELLSHSKMKVDEKAARIHTIECCESWINALCQDEPHSSELIAAVTPTIAEKYPR